MNGTGSSDSPEITSLLTTVASTLARSVIGTVDDTRPTGNQIELVLLITINVITLIFLMPIGICCCLPSYRSGAINEEEAETSRKLRQSPSNPDGLPYKQTATDPSSKSTKTTGTTKKSTTKSSTATKLDTFFIKSDKRYIPPPSGPPSTKDKVKISKLNNRKGPAPQPPKATSPTGGSSKVTPSKESDTYVNQMKPTVKSQYSIFHRGQGSLAGHKPNAINKSSPTKNPSFRPSSSSPRTGSPTPSGSRTGSPTPSGSRTGIRKQASVIKRTVTPFVPDKKLAPEKELAPEKKLAVDKRMSSRNVTEVPTVVIAPSDYQHVFSSKERMKQRSGSLVIQRNSGEPKDDTTSTHFRLSSQRSRSPKRPAPQPQQVFKPNPPPTPVVFPPKAPVTTKVPSPTRVAPALSFPPPVSWDVDDETDPVKNMNNIPSEELFKAGRVAEQQRAAQVPAEGENIATRVPTGPPTIGDQSPTDPTLEEVVNQATNPEGQNDGSSEGAQGEPNVTRTESNSSVGSRKEQFDKLKNLLSKQ